jgi:hypothetical protein
METGLTKNTILSELSRSPHGDLKEYINIGQQAAKQEAEFFAHLIAWDAIKGQVRDAKVALPIVSLSVPSFPGDLVENSLAHLARLGPRELLRALRFAKEVPGIKASKRRKIMSVIQNYLRQKEAKGWTSWQHLAVQHKHTLKELYALSYTKPSSNNIRAVLFGKNEKGEKIELPKGSLAEKVTQLKDMTAVQAAGAIMKYNIPFLIIQGALGKRLQEPDIAMALIKSMSATELVTNIKLLEKLGMKTNPALRGAYEESLGKAAKSTKNVLKTTRAAEAIEDVKLKASLQGLQDRQLQNMGVEGNWLVLGDRSTSMTDTIEVARHVAGVLAKMVKGDVWLCFFNTSPQSINVTGKPLDWINETTKHITANGGTSIGCGLQRMLDSKVEVDGIAVVSDAAENSSPWFADVYKKYSELYSKEVPVYLYRTINQSNYSGDIDLKVSMNKLHFDLQEFNLTKKIDHYSIPNLVATMRTNRYSLIDEIMATPLLTLKDVFLQLTTKEAVHA